MKPIETKYKGYRFRSRLEARWAVFFDALGCKDWEYEPEGFDLGGVYYLPDFKIGDKWFEVKPSISALTAEEKMKLRLFAGAVANQKCDHPQCPIQIPTGAKRPAYPPPNQPLVVSFIDATRECHRPESFFLLDGMPDWTSYARVSADKDVTESDRWLWFWSSRGRWWYDRPKSDYHLYGEHGEFLRSAIDAARSARFEHGECP